MPGYSGTPLPKKLGIKDGLRVALLHVPAEVKSDLQKALAKCPCARLDAGNLDFIFLFVKSQAALESELQGAARALAPAGMLWIAWPKKSSGVVTDLVEDMVREAGLAAGLVDIKVCAVTDVWSGLKFVIPVKQRLKKH
ncbi:MAG TPA: DUF3052 family protein [Terriglobales bacterium]|nr:DUF3052 family protein [Terriglobales bacterium]